MSQKSKPIKLHARKTDPHTSEEAAEHAERQAQSIADVILDILPADGMTSDEIAEATQIRLVSVSPLLSKMEEQKTIFRIVVGISERTGKPRFRTRLNASGRPAIIWYKTDIPPNTSG